MARCLVSLLALGAALASDSPRGPPRGPPGPRPGEPQRRRRRPTSVVTSARTPPSDKGAGEENNAQYYGARPDQYPSTERPSPPMETTVEPAPPWGGAENEGLNQGEANYGYRTAPQLSGPPEPGFEAQGTSFYPPQEGFSGEHYGAPADLGYSGHTDMPPEPVSLVESYRQGPWGKTRVALGAGACGAGKMHLFFQKSSECRKKERGGLLDTRIRMTNQISSRSLHRPWSCS